MGNSKLESTKLELTPASELSQIRPRPQPIDLRIGLAIHWALSKHDMPVSDADRKKLKLTVKGLAATFQRELGHVGLKLVWADGATPLGDHVHFSGHMRVMKNEHGCGR